MSGSLLKQALGELESVKPPLMMTLPAMFEAGVPFVDTTDGAADQLETWKKAPDDKKPFVRFDGSVEKSFLERYFAPPGAPRDKKFFSPYKQHKNSTRWVNSDYHGSTLQAQRKERVGTVYVQSAEYFFPRGASASEFADRVRESWLVGNKADGTTVASLFWIGVWLLRSEEIVATPGQSIAETLIANVRASFAIPDAMIGTVYSDTIPGDVDDAIFGDQPLTAEDLAEAIEAPPPPPVLTNGLSGLAGELEKRLSKRMLLADGVVGRIVRAWAAQDIVILVGGGGTGKTTLATGLIEALGRYLPQNGHTTVPVEPDFSVADLLGYENLAGAFVDTELTTRVLRSRAGLHPHVILLEELNVAQVESYLGPILHGIESGEPIALTGRESVRLPIDTLVLATCNAVRDEPDTRRPLSGPTKRRATIITMPNILRIAFQKDAENGISDAVNKILERERQALEDRAARGQATWLDAARGSALSAIQTFDDLDDVAGEVLVEIVGYLLQTPEGARWMTLGPLRDIVVQVVFADAGSHAAALGDQITDKLLQQVGTVEVAQGIRDRSDALPNAEQIAAAVRELADKSGRVRPLI